MRFTHPAHPGKAVRLAYCLNVHPAEDLAGVVRGLETITLPLRERLAPRGAFGVGLYLPAAVFAPSGNAPGGAHDRESATFLASREAERVLGELCERHRLDPFTCNAFPFGGFHGERLKERVFEPTWLEVERARYTFAVARLASRLASRGTAPGERRSHVSISTHTGLHSSSPRARVAPNVLGACFGAVLDELPTLAPARAVLALEPEPRANCGDTRELVRFFEEGLLAARDRRAVGMHAGVCLDACHAAVEFEEPAEALRRALACGAGIAKLQFSNAVRLRDPARDHAGREALFAMAEPRYLHQVTGRGPAGLVRAGDLDEARAAFERGDPAWRECEEWRCHFHVPIDRARLGGGEADVGGLETTRDVTDAIVALALGDPRSWGLDELHLELETYTWDVLPAHARATGAGARPGSPPASGAGDLTDDLISGLEREYRHALGLLQRAGWVEESAPAR